VPSRKGNSQKEKITRDRHKRTKINRYGTDQERTTRETRSEGTGEKEAVKV
jgi:hypothetical protein